MVLEKPDWNGLSFRKEVVTEDGEKTGNERASASWKSKRTVVVTGSLSPDGLTLHRCCYMLTERRDETNDPKDPGQEKTASSKVWRESFVARGVTTNSVGFSVGAGGDPDKVAAEAEFRLSGGEMSGHTSVTLEIRYEHSDGSYAETKIDSVEKALKSTFNLRF